MNWGKGIMIGMGLFMGFILFLVISLMTHRVDLESEDYYKKEIHYEDEIQALRNADALNDKIKISSSDKFIIVKIPDSLEAEKIKLKLIRQDDENLDKEVSINGTKTFLLPTDDLATGKYLTELHFYINNQPYLQKSDLYLKK